MTEFDEDPKKPSGWSLYLAFFVGIYGGVVGYLRADARWEEISSICLIPAGLLIFGAWVRDKRRYDSFFRSLEQRPSKRPPWV